MKFIGILILFSLSTGSFAQASRTIDWQNNSELSSAPVAKHTCNALYCPRSADYELALEKEFWRHVQADDSQAMGVWLKKMKRYVGHFSHRNQHTEHKGRLFMLGAGGHTMIFSDYDLQPLVPVLNSLKEHAPQNFVSSLYKAAKLYPALYHLLESLRLSAKSNHRVEHLNGQTFYIALLGFASFALDDFLPENFNHSILYGPSCDAMSDWMKHLTGNVCLPRGAIGPHEASWRDCIDKESCQNIGTGTEGMAAITLAMGLLGDEEKNKQALLMMGDEWDGESLADCESFWCKNASPNDENADVPEATTIAPFKKVNMILAAAEIYGKVNEIQKAKAAIAAARKEARRIQWPFADRIDEVERSLFVQHPGYDRSLLEIWNDSDAEKDFLGKVQLPLPNYGAGCKGCHFAGQLPSHVNYHN